MKKIALIAMAAAFLAACSSQNRVTVNVSNDLDFDRAGEMVEVEYDAVVKKLGLSDSDKFVIYDDNRQEVPYQITSDNTVIFRADVKADGKSSYIIEKGIPAPADTLCYGRVFTERMDDMSWENDKCGFRAYGPELEKIGERGYGYDLFTKRGTKSPVLEKMYANELDPVIRPRVTELKRTDMKAAKELERTISYHVDHGYGMDCYAVGPTLGAGVSALMVNDTIVYPWCYNKEEILDNGPLRFKVKLTFNPLNIKGDTTVVESRIITLDAGSYLNKTEISYANLKESLPIVTGIVLHDSISEVCMDAENGYMTYVDPTTGPDNGKIFLGAAFPEKEDDMRTVLFSDSERKMRNNAFGHLLAFSNYAPGENYVYYWGFGWSRADMKNIAEWDNYMKNFTIRLKHPLKVTVE